MAFHLLSGSLFREVADSSWLAWGGLVDGVDCGLWTEADRVDLAAVLWAKKSCSLELGEDPELKLVVTSFNNG
jgi:hypothetical protein